jgi:hypothetical protein
MAKQKKPRSAFNESQRRVKQREAIVGKKGVTAQRGSHARGRLRAVAKGVVSGDIATAIHKEDTKQTIKRVGEYKAAKLNNAGNRLGNKVKK